MIAVQEKQKLTRLDAYGLASMTMDCRLQDLDESKAVHCMLPKSLWVARNRCGLNENGRFRRPSFFVPLVP
jgi:hypothetical protein